MNAAGTRANLFRKSVAAFLLAAGLRLISSAAYGAEQDDTVYQNLVQRVEGGDFTVDFRALRLACIRSSQCDPRGKKADLVAMNRAVDDRDFRATIEVAERLIRQGFVNAEAHATCVAAYLAIHEPVKSKFHLDVTKALVRSILTSGDGKTKETAYQVISDREEYFAITALGLPYLGPGNSATTTQDAGHSYDRWEIRDPRTGKNVVLFFDVDAFSPTKSRASDK